MRDIRGSKVGQRLLESYEDVAERIRILRELGYSIGLTSGSWDLLHRGHARFIERLAERVDIVIVGVDSDEKVRARKGKYRPVVPEDERVEMLCHSRHVDLVFVKQVNDQHMRLIQTVRPDVLLVTQETYQDKPEEMERLREFCGEIMNLEPQAKTSTTARIRIMLVEHLEKVMSGLDTVREMVEGMMSGETLKKPPANEDPYVESQAAGDP